MTVFVDTSAWIAIADSEDQYHSLAKTEFARLEQTHNRLVTTNFVTDETLTALLKKIGYIQTVALGDYLFYSPTIKLHRLSSQQELESWSIFKQYNHDKYWSFTDCTSYVVMKAHHITQVFTFDQHFSQMGFTVIPNH